MARKTRAMEARKAEQRPMPRTQHRGDLFVDPTKIPRGMTYRWIRESMLGQPDPQNVTKRQINGWMPVPADRHPELVPPPLPGYEGTAPLIIRVGGQILFEKPTRDIEADRAELRKENAEIMGSIAWTGQADPNMPRQDYGSSVGIERVTADPAFKDD